MTDIDAVIALAHAAGEAILEVYQREDHGESRKDDTSPLTEADLASHRVLVAGLRRLVPELPILSEEAELPDWRERSGWRRYWLIDPLDGTKEFLKRNGEFTVNIALIEEGVPVLGVVGVPVLGITYAGVRGVGAWRIDADGRAPIRTRAMAGRGGGGAPVTVVASRSHGADTVAQWIEAISGRVGQIETRNMGSSLKLCLVAEGSADIYPRLAPTAEWDTAAAQAVVEAAGGLVLTDDLRVMRYNAKAELLNPHFFVIGDQDYPWRDVLAAR
ncbi:MAG TPA: 3'(2'),5'-bisphosphate nucleotidase CysQ [Porticoccaceae bacterium]|nr:3'(2'),5'-bisphosphate nucleotidase CysQ [Porticoccaceae bacterium]